MLVNYSVLSRTFLLSFLLLQFISYAQINPKREFRAAWIATVENIDWPSKPGLTVKQQKTEFRALLDRLKKAGLNAVVVQIRPATDAFYPSPFEPWSIYLTGNMDAAPKPYYDPLLFMIKEAHDRSMEFHAWLNPYRALNHSDLSIVSQNHPLRQHPNWFVQYGGKYYFNPGLPESKHHILKVIRNILNRYDLDALHFDDYFYPYKVAGEDFPDVATYMTYNTSFTNIEDWRRNNVSQLIFEIHQLIQEIKPSVQLGISPFSVWRNSEKDPLRGSPTRAGQTCYDDLYADILLWLEKGWIDYIAPQLYFPIGFDLIDPEIMMKWWAERAHGKNVYIGKGLYRVGSDRTGWKDPQQLPDQIIMARNHEQVQGSIFFSAKWFYKNPLDVIDNISSTLYKTPALLPEIKSSNLKIPSSPVINKAKRKRKYTKISWAPASIRSDEYYYVVYRFSGKSMGDLNDSRSIKYLTSFNPSKLEFIDRKSRRGNYYTYVVSPVNRDHIEGVPSAPITLKSR